MTAPHRCQVLHVARSPAAPRALLPAALLAIVACTPDPTPASVAPLLLAGDEEAAWAQVADSDDPTLATWRALLARSRALDAPRAAIHAAERDMLADAAEAALDADDFSAAAGPLQAGLSAYPQDPRFRALRLRLEQAAAEAPPEAAAAAWAAVAGAVAHDLALQREALRRHRLAALQLAYAPDHLAETRASQAGVRPSAAKHLVDKLDREYHVAPDWEAALHEARDALRAVARAPGSPWPTLADVQWPAPASTGRAASAHAHLDAALALAREAGVPDEVTVDVWTQGLLAGLDPWTRAVWPAEIAAWEQHHAGVTLGVGLELEATPGGAVRVVRPLPDSPAWTSGIHQDDVLLRLEDDRFIASLPDIDASRRLEVAERVLAGDPGTAVQLTVARGEQTLDFELTRGPVPLQTVEGFERAPDNAWRPWLDEEDGLAWARISTFREASQPDFDALLADHHGRLRGLVLDLRGNPGGDVNAAVQIGDRFVAEGILAELEGRVDPETGPDIDPETGRRLLPWNAAVPGEPLEGVPTVVLVDEDTASAAEILAGILQERAGAVVLGEPTWGKGLAQALRAEPEHGYAVQFTNQVWALPSGRRLSREVAGGGGIQPDVLESLSPGEAFQVRLQARERAALRRHHDGAPMRRLDTQRKQDLPPLPEDPMMVRAELLLRAMLTPPAG